VIENHPSTEIHILIRAYEPISRRSIFDETIKSDYGRLDSFLKLHNVTLTQSSLGGYLGDVSSQENSAPTSYRNRNRWTSSTLGSEIPRQSIKTIETISPTESPNDEGELIVNIIKYYLTLADHEYNVEMYLFVKRFYSCQKHE